MKQLTQVHTNKSQSNYKSTNLTLLKMFLAQTVKSPSDNNEKNWRTPTIIAFLTQNVNHNGTNTKTTNKNAHKNQSNYKKTNFTLLKIFLGEAEKTATNNNEKNWQTLTITAPLTQNENHNGTNNKTTNKNIHK
jgi:hypothetical protein